MLPLLGPFPYLVKHYAAPRSQCGRNRRGKDIPFFLTNLMEKKIRGNPDSIRGHRRLSTGSLDHYTKLCHVRIRDLTCF